MLLLRFLDRLLELDLRVGVLLEAARELRGHVLPPAPHGFEHARQPTAAVQPFGRRGTFLEALAQGFHVADESLDVVAEARLSSETSPADSDSSTARATASSRRASSTSSRWRASVRDVGRAVGRTRVGLRAPRTVRSNDSAAPGASGREPRIRSRWLATSFSVERLHARRRARRPGGRPASTPAPRRRSVRRSRPAGRAPGRCGRPARPRRSGGGR